MQDNGSANRRFLRQLVGEPNPNDFLETAHVYRHKSAHVYQLSLGQTQPDTTGLWAIQCQYVVKTPKKRKCPPVVAKKPADFKEVDSTAGRLLDGIKKVNESLVSLDQFSNASPLHGKAKLRIGKRLATPPANLEKLDWSILVDYPLTTLDGKAKAHTSSSNATGKAKAKEPGPSSPKGKGKAKVTGPPSSVGEDNASEGSEEQAGQ
ncbi:hypothetical protein B0H13DRAFT_2312026 [Mycena leptocephala]|nr:hypothetical protein B0H13DRAFT_2312026 [Mycena leptocephala]